MNRLIINADDFGYCPRRNRAICDLFVEHRAISSASLLVNGDFSDEARRVQLPFGLHLNLTEGRPISVDRSRIRSLIDADGFFHGKFGLRTKLSNGEIEREHLLYEIEMQMIKFRELTNLEISTHFDGHQHIHVHPMIVNDLSQLARKHRFDFVRLPIDPLLKEVSWKNPFYDEIIEQSQSAKTIFDQHRLNYPKFFFGLTTMGKNMNFESVEQSLKYFSEHQDGNSFAELMCHPGFPSDSNVGGCGTGHPDEFSQSIERQNEFDVLSSKKMKIFFEKYNVQLSIYSMMP